MINQQALFSRLATLSAVAVLVSVGCTTHINNLNPVGPGKLHGVTITNNSDSTITYLSYKLRSSTTWNTNQLTGSLSYGQASMLTLPTDTFDIKVTSSSGAFMAFWKVAISADLSLQVKALINGASPPYQGVLNLSDETIYYLYSRVTGTSTWSGDLLPSSEITSDKSDGVALSAAGSYDFMAVSTSYDTAMLTDVALSTGQCYTWSVTNSSFTHGGSTGTQNTLTLVNNTSSEVYWAFVRPAGASSWGTERLGSRTIQTGYQDTLLVNAGYVDIMLISNIYDTLKYLDQNLNANLQITVNSWTAATTGSIQINNSNTGYTFSMVYISPTIDTAWGPNLLTGGATIASGTSRAFTGLAADSYDILVISKEFVDVWAKHSPISVVAGQTTTNTFTLADFSLPTGNLKITNAMGSDTVYYVYARPHFSGDWGDDELDISSVTYIIEPGENFWNGNTYSGAYDLVAFNRDSSKYAMLSNTTFSPTAYTWPVTALYPTSSVTVTNNSTTYSISDLYIKPVSGDSYAWSSDLLGNLIAAYGTSVIRGLTPDTYVIEADESSGYYSAFDTVTVTGNGQSLSASFNTSQFH